MQVGRPAPRTALQIAWSFSFAAGEDCAISGEIQAAARDAEIDGKARHLAHKEIDRRAALQGEGVIHEYQWCDLGQQPRGLEVCGRHGFSTSNPSGD